MNSHELHSTSWYFFGKKGEKPEGSQKVLYHLCCIDTFGIRQDIAMTPHLSLHGGTVAGDRASSASPLDGAQRYRLHEMVLAPPTKTNVYVSPIISKRQTSHLSSGSEGGLEGRNELCPAQGYPCALQSDRPHVPEWKGTYNHVEPYKLYQALRLLDTAIAGSVAYWVVSRTSAHSVYLCSSTIDTTSCGRT